MAACNSVVNQNDAILNQVQTHGTPVGNHMAYAQKLLYKQQTIIPTENTPFTQGHVAQKLSYADSPLDPHFTPIPQSIFSQIGVITAKLDQLGSLPNLMKN